MNKFFAMMVAVMATLFAANAMAFTPPPSPAPQSWISDPGHVLSDTAHARLDAKLRVINQNSANEIAALIVPSLNGDSIEDVGDLTIKAWGVGKKGLDNGVLVVLAMAEHKSRISTGKGVEGDLPDLKCNDILQAMRPFLRSGNIEGALGYAFDQSSSLIANHKAEAQAAADKGSTPQASSQSPSNGSGCQVSASGGSGLILALAFACGGLLVWWMTRRSHARTRESMQAFTPVVKVPVVPIMSPPVAPSFPVAPAVAAAVIGNETAEAEARRQREEDDNRRRRQQSEEDDRRRRSESYSSSSSSPSFDWGSSGSGGGFDSGGSGGFGGGDSGGGGASGGW
jgi:uncharacterized protein